ncbi:MAG: DUF6464 family protein [Crocosphaera sp.]|nr:DUF6464 family protein [Crocosphaera sp.]
MNQESILTEVILSHNHQSLGKLKLDWSPKKGSEIEIEGQIYTILEYHHHYQYQIGGYRLQKTSLYVQATVSYHDRSFVNGRWILGDINCRFNANSEIVRCAVNPQNSCESCHFFELKNN